MGLEAQHDAQTLLDKLSLPAYLYEAESGRILGANAALCELFGYTPEELRGMSAPNLYAEEEREAMWELMSTLPSEGSGDRRLRTSGGAVLRARVRFRNSEIMSPERQYLLTRLVVITASQPEVSATSPDETLPVPQAESSAGVKSGHGK